MNGLLAAFDFASIVSLVTENILPLLIGGGIVAAPVNTPGTPYTSLIQMLLTKIGIVKPSTPAVPGNPTTTSPLLSLIPLLGPILAQLADKKPVATPVAPIDPAVIEKDPTQLMTWLLSLLNAPEKIDTIIEPQTKDGDVATLLGYATAVAAKNPDSDVTITIDANGVNAKVVKRVVAK